MIAATIEQPKHVKQTLKTVSELDRPGLLLDTLARLLETRQALADEYFQKGPSSELLTAVSQIQAEIILIPQCVNRATVEQKLRLFEEWKNEAHQVEQELKLARLELEKLSALGEMAAKLASIEARRFVRVSATDQNEPLAAQRQVVKRLSGRLEGLRSRAQAAGISLTDSQNWEKAAQRAGAKAESEARIYLQERGL